MPETQQIAADYRTDDVPEGNSGTWKNSPLS
jgi:hypothetical protein